MPLFSAENLKRLGTGLFEAAGAPASDAELVADHLVESGLLGHDTHSVLRFPQYVDMIREGVVRCGAPLEVLEETACTARLSGGWNFGPVTATLAVEHAAEKAQRAGVAVATVLHCNHIARLGRFAALAAQQELIAVVLVNGHGGDLAVAPFGGSARRLPTNPVCVAIPTGREWPVVLDMTTSMLSGGDMRLYRNRNEPVPPGHIVDADGRPTEAPEAYYGPPPGAILPLGWPLSGHKGFGLSLVVDILAGALSGAGCSRADPETPGNALFIALLDIAAFAPVAEFRADTERFIDWIKSCPPAAGFDEVLLPGEKSFRTYQRRRRDGLFVDQSAWTQISRLASELQVELPQPDSVEA